MTADFMNKHANQTREAATGATDWSSAHYARHHRDAHQYTVMNDHACHLETAHTNGNLPTEHKCTHHCPLCVGQISAQPL